jgi:hypothetical protein
MPCLAGQSNPAIGPIINVGVIPAGTIAAGAPPGGGQISTFPALIDTGASTTCISAAVAQAVGLSPIGMHPMVSANQSAPANVYLVDLVLQYGPSGIIMAGMQVMEFLSPPAPSPFEMLVGRDILSRGIFTLSFDGHFTFSI